MSERRATSLTNGDCIPQNHAGVALRCVPTCQWNSAVRGIPQTNQLRLIESPSPRTTRDELGHSRLGEVDSVVAVSELGGVRRSSAIWKQGPRFGKVLVTVSAWAGRDPLTVTGSPSMPKIGRPPASHPPWIGLQRSTLHGMTRFGSVQKLGDTRRQACGTHADESFDPHDTPEQER